MNETAKMWLGFALELAGAALKALPELMKGEDEINAEMMAIVARGPLSVLPAKLTENNAEIDRLIEEKKQGR